MDASFATPNQVYPAIGILLIELMKP